MEADQRAKLERLARYLSPPLVATGQGLTMGYPLAVRARHFVATLTLMPLTSSGPPLLDFSSPDVVRTFQVINDNVMGGISTSRLSPASGAMLFEGEVSLEKTAASPRSEGPSDFPPGPQHCN